jgi:hypothetical protein
MAAAGTADRYELLARFPFFSPVVRSKHAVPIPLASSDSPSGVADDSDL